MEETCDNLDSVNNFQTKRERRKQREKATPGKGLQVIFNPLFVGVTYLTPGD